MLRQQGIRLVAALALAVALAGPVAGAQAAGPVAPGRTAEEGLAGLWIRAWDWLGGALPWLSITAATCDRSSSIDPNGQCALVAAPPCDPDGGCALGAAADTGQ
jgi:hypothetical protein